jgi:hypothetical protein
MDKAETRTKLITIKPFTSSTSAVQTDESAGNRIQKRHLGDICKENDFRHITNEPERHAPRNL